MIDRLPYKLSDGVVAAKDGLRFDSSATSYRLFSSSCVHIKNRAGWRIKWSLLRWPVAAERLRYREDEPWCHDYIDAILCYDPYIPPNVKGVNNPLNRLAAVLCDDGNAFRVLYRCIHNLGGSK